MFRMSPCQSFSFSGPTYLNECIINYQHAWQSFHWRFLFPFNQLYSSSTKSNSQTTCPCLGSLIITINQGISFQMFFQGGTSHSGPSPSSSITKTHATNLPTDKSYGGVFSVESPSTQMALASVKLT